MIFPFNQKLKRTNLNFVIYERDYKWNYLIVVREDQGLCVPRFGYTPGNHGKECIWLNLNAQKPSWHVNQ